MLISESFLRWLYSKKSTNYFDRETTIENNQFSGRKQEFRKLEGPFEKMKFLEIRVEMSK